MRLDEQAVRVAGQRLAEVDRAGQLGAGSTGVAISTVPICDAGGHAIASCVPLPNSRRCSREAVAAAGLIVMPSGSVTETSLTCAVASVAAS